MKQKQLSKLNVHVIVCNGGPFHGQKFRLSNGYNTFVFTAKGQTGRYVNGEWNAIPKH